MPTIATTLQTGLPGRVQVEILDRRPVLITLAVLGAMSFFYNQDLAPVVQHLALPDTDDAMRLVGVRDLLTGQGWFDHVQHRYLPPMGAWMPWSRLLDLPLAVLIAALTPALGRRLAEGWVAALWPPALFMAYLVVAFVGTRRIFGFRPACFSVFVAGQLCVSQLFAYGRVDHHNVQILALTTAALALAGRTPGLGAGLLAGLSCGFSLAIGLETVPFIAALGGMSVLLWAFGADRRPLIGLGAGLAVGSLAFGLVDTPPWRWFEKSCDFLSPPWLILAVGGGLGVAALATVFRSHHSPISRLFAAALLGCGLLASFCLLYPDCLNGPWGTLPEAARTGWLDAVEEMQPFWRVLLKLPISAVAVAMPMVVAGAAAGVIAWVSWRSGDSECRTFAILAAFTVTGVAITLVHVRGYYVGAALVPVIGGWLFDRAIRLASDKRTRTAPNAHQAAWASAAALMTLTYLDAAPVVAVSSLFNLSQAAPASAHTAEGCSGDRALAAFDGLPAGTVLAQIDLGPSLLLHTRHAIIAAPYHRNGDGIVAGLAVESGGRDTVLAALKRFRPDYLAACRKHADEGSDGDFARQLEKGATIPWLDPALSAGDLLVYRVRPDRFTP